MPLASAAPLTAVPLSSLEVVDNSGEHCCARRGLFCLAVLPAQRTRRPTLMAMTAEGSKTSVRKPFLRAVIDPVATGA